MKKTLSYSLMVVVLIGALIRCDTLNVDPGAILDDDETFTDDERLAVLEACHEKAMELNNLKEEEDKIEFLVWLYGQPEFSDAGFAGADLFAVFKDERIAFFVNTPLTDETGGRLPSGGRVITNTESSSAGRTEDLPKDKKVSLFNGMGKYFDDNTLAIQTIFTASKTKYQVERKAASIQNLKAVSGDAVFYIFTHGGGGAIPLPNKKDSLYIMSLWTTDAVDRAGEGAYKDYLLKKEVAYMRSTYDSEVPVWHYGITSEFIKAHMSFGENCIIYVDACNSFRENQAAEDYRAVVMGKAVGGGATYVGWTMETNALFAPRASQFIFDRLLGTNSTGSGVIPKENPIQRPFDLAPIFEDLTRNGFDKCANGATLSYTTLNPDEILLTPTIESMEVDEYTSTLYLHGLFGHHEGLVSINGTSAGVTSWSPNFISCIIPQTGSGSVGDVIVESPQGHKSNPVPLTEWLIKVNYSSDDNHVKMEGVCTLRLRGDVHPTRTKPHETPKRPGDPDYALGGPFNMKGSSATYTISGQKFETCTLDGCVNKFTETITPKSGRVDFAIPPAVGPSVVASYVWGPERKYIIIDAIAISHPDTESSYVASLKCPNEAERVSEFDSPFGSTFVHPITAESNADFKLEIAENYNIRPGSLTKSRAKPWSLCNGNGKYTIVAQWQVVTPNFAPTSETPARKAVSTPTDD